MLAVRCPNGSVVQMSERWAQEFELRARALWTDDAVRRVTEGKDLPILPSNAPTLLRSTRSWNAVDEMGCSWNTMVACMGCVLRC